MNRDMIKHAEQIIRKRKGFENFKTDKVPEDDKKTFELFCNGQTSAVFQFESPGMQKILRQFQPEKIEDLVALNALYRRKRRLNGIERPSPFFRIRKHHRRPKIIVPYPDKTEGCNGCYDRFG